MAAGAGPCCPGCSACGGRVVLRADDGLSLLTCPVCQLVYPWPALDDSQDAAFYPAAYYTHQPAQLTEGRSRAVRSLVLHRYYGYPLAVSELPESAIRRLAAYALRPLTGHWRTIPPAVPAGRILDVGCGNGLYLARLRSLGWDVYGLEPDAAACDLARQRGLPVVCATLEQNPWPANVFDVITFWHSLEHMPQPQRALAVALRLLRPGGLCMLEVPNWASVQRRLFNRRWFHLDLPRHRAYFARDCLSRYVLRAGFQELHVSAVPSTVGVTGSLERLAAANHSRGGFRHNRALKALAWLPEALLSPLGLAGCTLVTARKP